MQENNRDFDSVLKCLSNNRDGIECLHKDENFLTSLVPLFSAIKPTNKRPDAIAENGTTLLLLEHFQFDNSRLNKKGSLQNQTAAKTDRELNNLLTDKEFAIVNESVEKCGLYYIENFQKQFDSHVKNIDSYKLEIQEESKKKYDKYLMGFIIEDSSPLGSVYFDGGLKCVDLVYSKEFLDVFEQTPQLDFVVFAMTGNEDNRILSFISQNTISLHRERQITVSSISKFLFENSICAGGKIYIPNK